MDEPLSNLDALLRLEMRAELKRLLSEIGSTTVYVTHDQVEAMSMGDRIAVMRTGKILQLGDPLDIYQKPVDRFVGGFIGNPPMNFIKATLQRPGGEALHAAIEGAGALAVDAEHTARLGGHAGQPVLLGVRAENIEVVNEDRPGQDLLRAHVLVVEPLGSHNLLTVTLGSEQVKVSTRPDLAVKAGDGIRLQFEQDRITWLDPETERSITA